jgi:hypothetical protein
MVDEDQPSARRLAVVLGSGQRLAVAAANEDKALPKALARDWEIELCASSAMHAGAR